MSEPTFNAGAARLAGLAGLLFGWRPGEFWSATPAELAVLIGAAMPRPDRAGSADLARLQEMFPDG